MALAFRLACIFNVREAFPDEGKEEQAGYANGEPL
jgi:hypothetical protein